MATPGQLTSNLAKLCAIPASAVEHPWRVLREAGIVTKGGRGKSAAHITATDAANLLIAVAASMPAASILDAWREFSSMRAFKKGLADRDMRPGQRIAASKGVSPTWALDGLPFEKLRGLGPRHTIVEALAALIEDVSDPVIQSALSPPEFSDSLIDVSVRLSGPMPGGEIRVSFSNRIEEVHYDSDPIHLEDGPEASIKSARRADQYFRGDMEQTRKFFSRTIVGLSRLVFPRQGQLA